MLTKNRNLWVALAVIVNLSITTHAALAQQPAVKVAESNPAIPVAWYAGKGLGLNHRPENAEAGAPRYSVEDGVMRYEYKGTHLAISRQGNYLQVVGEKAALALEIFDRPVNDAEGRTFVWVGELSAKEVKWQPVNERPTLNRYSQFLVAGGYVKVEKESGLFQDQYEYGVVYYLGNVPVMPRFKRNYFESMRENSMGHTVISFQGVELPGLSIGLKDLDPKADLNPEKSLLAYRGIDLASLHRLVRQVPVAPVFQKTTQANIQSLNAFATGLFAPTQITLQNFPESYIDEEDEFVSLQGYLVELVLLLAKRQTNRPDAKPFKAIVVEPITSGNAVCNLDEQGEGVLNLKLGVDWSWDTYRFMPFDHRQCILNK